MTITQPMWTLESLSESGPPGLWEIIDGELREVSPAGGQHGRIGMRLGRLIAPAADEQCGMIYGPDTGFVLRRDPLLLRVPDVAYVSEKRLPEEFESGSLLELAPDIVAEVISPSDRMIDVLTKAVMWLEHGTSLVWVLDPKKTTLTIYESDAAPILLSAEDMLTAGEILPSLSLNVARIFALRG